MIERGIYDFASSWQRFALNTIPFGAKADGNYLFGQLVARESRPALARAPGLDRAAPRKRRREPVPIVRHALYTPPVSAALLDVHCAEGCRIRGPTNAEAVLRATRGPARLAEAGKSKIKTSAPYPKT